MNPKSHAFMDIPCTSFDEWRARVLATEPPFNGGEQDVYNLITHVAVSLGYPQCITRIRWLFEEFSIDPMTRNPFGLLRIFSVPCTVIPLLCKDYGFDVNVPADTGSPSSCVTYADSMLSPSRDMSPAFAKWVVYSGARKTALVAKQHYPLFDARSRCAQATRALLAALRRWSSYVARDVALVMARMVWRTRCELEIWPKRGK